MAPDANLKLCRWRAMITRSGWQSLSIYVSDEDLGQWQLRFDQRWYIIFGPSFPLAYSVRASVCSRLSLLLYRDDDWMSPINIGWKMKICNKQQLITEKTISYMHT